MEKLNKNKITCVLTGIVVRVAPQTFDERAQRYGGVDNLLSNYICAEGRKLLRDGKTVDEIRTQYNVSEDVPMPSQEIITKHTKWSHALKDTELTYTDMPAPVPTPLAQS